MEIYSTTRDEYGCKQYKERRDLLTEVNAFWR